MGREIGNGDTASSADYDQHLHPLSGNCLCTIRPVAFANRRTANHYILCKQTNINPFICITSQSPNYK